MTHHKATGIAAVDLDKLEALAKAATPGPWTVRLDGTCSGTWPHIDAAEPDEYGDPVTVAELPTSHVETSAARESGEMPGSYEEKPHRFEPIDGAPSLVDAAYIAAANPITVLALIAQARAAAPVITAEKVETEMAERLRRIVVNIGEGPITVTSKLLTQAADECDRFYNGMMNWKATAQAKDRTIIELRAAAPVSERAEDARDELRERVLEMWANFERMGEVCSFEGNSMIYASTLEELAAMAATNTTKEGA